MRSRRCGYLWPSSPPPPDSLPFPVKGQANSNSDTGQAIAPIFKRNGVEVAVLVARCRYTGGSSKARAGLYPVTGLYLAPFRFHMRGGFHRLGATRTESAP